MNFDSIDFIRAAAQSNVWGAILPEICIACLALLLLVLETILPRKAHDQIPIIAIFGQVGVLAGLLMSFQPGWVGHESFNGLLVHSVSGQLMRVFFVLASILVCLLGRITLARQAMPRVEFYHIVLVVTAAMMLLAQANNFVLFFVTLETLTIGLYILVSYFRTNPATLEAGLKYLIMGALSSSLLLFGIVLLYGVAGNPALPGHTSEAMNFPALADFLRANPHNYMASIGIILVLSGVAFKIGGFPFQIWIPDVYQGAPTPVTAFLAVASKGAGFAILLLLTGNAFAPYSWLVTPVLTLMAGATILFGNIAALPQHNVKRLIGLSGVSHAGFLLLGVVAAPLAPLGYGAVFFYLFAYLIASFAVFGVMAHVAGTDDTDQDLDHYAGLARQNPFLATVLAVGLGSLAGIPPLAGFMGKLFVFIAAFEAHLYGLLFVAITGVVISIYYYFGWIRAAFFDVPAIPSDEATARPIGTSLGAVARVTLACLALGSIFLGFYQGIFGQWLSLR